MGQIIDTSVFISLERKKISLTSVLFDEEQESFLSAISVSELLHGVHRAKDARIKAQRSAFVERIVSRIPSIAFDAGVARTHAILSSELAGKGTTVGAHDLMIAATATTFGHQVITCDKRSFPKIPGLRLKVL